MLWLRFGSLLILALWIGGLVALGAVGAPVIFATLEHLSPGDGRELAGRVFGAVLTRFHLVSAAMGTLLLLLLGARAALGPRPRRWKLRMWALTLMLTLTAVTGWVVTPRIERIRDSVHGPVASLPADDPRSVSFGRLHGLSNGLMLGTLLIGTWLFWVETREEP